MIDKNMSRHGFLFGDNDGPWSTEQLTKVMIRETTTRIGFRMTTQEYRHIAIAIDRKFIRKDMVEFEDDDVNEEEDEDDVHDLMAVHSTKLASQRYARMGGLTRSLTAESISVFRTISDKWQRWFSMISRKPKEESMSSQFTQKETVTTESKVSIAMSALYGPAGRFRSSQQEEAVISVAKGISPLFVILPTGAGKSITFMLRRP